MEFCVCGCGGGPCIPQREYERQRTDPLREEDLQEMIRFSVKGRCGYPLEDALKKRYAGLDRRDDKMFVDCKSSISIRAEVRPAPLVRFYDGPKSYSQWLPYVKWTKQVGADSRVSLHGH
jgi:hypothetical protein